MAIKPNELADLKYTLRKKEVDEHRGAYLLTIEGKDVWIPKSLAELDEDDMTVTVPLWFAQEKELV